MDTTLKRQREVQAEDRHETTPWKGSRLCFQHSLFGWPSLDQADELERDGEAAAWVYGLT